MPRRIAAQALVVLVPAVWLAASCASPAKPAPRSRPAADAEFRSALDFEKAVAPLREAHHKNPRDKKLTSKYARMVETIKQAADLDARNGDFALALAGYEVLRADAPAFAGFAPGLSFSAGDVEAGIKTCRVGLAAAACRRHIAAGDYPSALAAWQPLLTDYHGDPSLSERYGSAAGEIRAAATRAAEKNDFAKAGAIDTLLLRNFRSLEGIRPPVGFSRKDLEDAIAVCRVSLTNSGLSEYRNGNLAKAIAVWESLLAFDPENAGVRKAVETARGQIKTPANAR